MLVDERILQSFGGVVCCERRGKRFIPDPLHTEWVFSTLKLATRGCPSG